MNVSRTYSQISNLTEDLEHEEISEESDEWTVSSDTQTKKIDEKQVPTKSNVTVPPSTMIKSTQSMLGKSLSKVLSRTISKFNKNSTQKFSSKKTFVSASSLDESAFTNDDIIVHQRSKTGGKQRLRLQEK